MHGAILSVLALAAAGATGWWLGNTVGEASAVARVAPSDRVDGTNDDRTRIGGDVRDAEVPTLVGTSSPLAIAPGAARARRAFEPLEALDFAAIETPDALVEHFLRWLDTKLRAGRTGHVELMDWIASLADPAAAEALEGHIERIFQGDGPQHLVHVWPLIRYAIERDHLLLDFVESVFLQAIEQPEWFERKMSPTAARRLDLDDAAGPLTFLVSALASPNRMARMREHLQTLLDQPEAGQPASIRSARPYLEQVLVLWSPPLSVEEAVQRATSGERFAEGELESFLSRVPAAAWTSIDPIALVEPAVRDEPRALGSLMAQLPSLYPGEVERLDDVIVASFATAKDPSAVRDLDDDHADYWRWGEVQSLRQTLELTGRRTWESQRGLVDRIARTGAYGANVVGRFVETARYGGRGRRPDEAWVRRFLAESAVTDELARELREQYGIK